jgi:hypothetical protein
MLDDLLQPAGVSAAGVPSTGVTTGVAAAGVSVVGVPTTGVTTGVAAAGEMRFAGVLPPEGTPTGKISVFSSRFFFGFGSGAARYCQFPLYKIEQST